MPEDQIDIRPTPTQEVLDKIHDRANTINNIVDEHKKNLPVDTPINDFAVKVDELIENMGVRDYLTGLYNREYFDNVLENAITERFIDNGETNFGIIMIDIDDFKKINDDYGHEVGDMVLQTLGSLLNSITREEDKVAIVPIIEEARENEIKFPTSNNIIPARRGGEEFALLIPLNPREHVNSTDEQFQNDLSSLAERIRSKIENTSDLLVVNGEQKGICVSIGAYYYDEMLQEGENLLEVRKKIIDRADKALYRAKRAGKNKAVLYTENKEGGPFKDVPKGFTVGKK